MNRKKVLRVLSTIVIGSLVEVGLERLFRASPKPVVQEKDWEDRWGESSDMASFYYDRSEVFDSED